MRISELFSIPCEITYPTAGGIETSGTIYLVCKTFSRSAIDALVDKSELERIKSIVVGIRGLEGVDSAGRDLSHEVDALEHCLDDMLILPVIGRALVKRLNEARTGN